MTVTLNLFQIYMICVSLYVNYYFFNDMEPNHSLQGKAKQVLFIICVETVLVLGFIGAKTL